MSESNQSSHDDFITRATAKAWTPAGDHGPPRVPLLVKRHVNVNGEVKTTSYDRAFHYDFEPRRVCSIDDLVAEVKAAALNPSTALLRAETFREVNGELESNVRLENARRRLHAKNNEPVPLRAAPNGRRYLTIDIDGLVRRSLGTGVPTSQADLEAIVRRIIERLPPWLKTATCGYHWSQSAGIDGWEKVDIHLFFWLTHPVCEASLLEHWPSLFPPDLCADSSLCRVSQLWFVGPPRFEGMPDPVLAIGGQRVGILRGETDAAEPPPELVDGPTWRQQQVQRQADQRRDFEQYSAERGDSTTDGVYIANYGLRSRMRALRRIKTAEKRHPVILDQSRKIGELVAAGALDHDSTLDALIEAAVSTGSANAEPTVRTFFEIGLQNPRDLSHVGRRRTVSSSKTRVAEDAASSSALPVLATRSDLAVCATDDQLPMIAPPGDEAAVSLALEEYLRRSGEVVAVGDTLYQYDADLGIWAPVQNYKLSSVVQRLSGTPVEVGVDKRGAPNIVALKVSGRVVTSAIKMMKDRVQDPTFFADAPIALVLSDGAWVATGGHLVWTSPSPELRQRHRHPWSRAEIEECAAPLWHEQTLRLAGDEEVAQPLLEFLGVSLFGLATRYQYSVFLYGPGNDGKTTFINAAASVFPEGSVCSVTLQDCRKEHFRAAVAEALLVAVSDLPSTPVPGEAASSWKGMVSGDPTSARKLYNDPITIAPRAGWLLAGNHLPDIHDNSDGFWRRILLIRCRSAITGRADRGFSDRLAAERPGILNSLIEAARRVLARGDLAIPQRVRANTADWRDANSEDPWETLVADWLAFNKGVEEVTTWLLLTRALGMTMSQASQRGHQMRMGRVLRALGYERRRSGQADWRGKRPWVYVRVSPASHPDPVTHRK